MFKTFDTAIDMSDEELLEFARVHRWKFARSMPRNPHWYTLAEWTDRRLFERFVMTVRRRGKVRWFWRKPYTHLEVGEWSYWTMGAPVGETILINRKPAAGYATANEDEIRAMCADPFVTFVPRSED